MDDPRDDAGELDEGEEVADVDVEEVATEEAPYLINDAEGNRTLHSVLYLRQLRASTCVDLIVSDTRLVISCSRGASR